MLSVHSLACERGDKKLFENLSFEVEARHALHVHGPNGAGKTTLLRALCGLVAPAAGRICWDGEDIQSLREEYFRRVSYFGHLNALKDELTGLENIVLALGLAGQSVDETVVSDMLARLGVEACQDLPVKVLSQGQKKRVALARIMLAGTPLWILDEPFTALDVNAVDVLSRMIVDHVSNGGMAVLTTHQDVGLALNQVRHIHLGKRG